MARKIFSPGGGLRQVIRCEIIVILSDTNRVPLINMEDRDQVSDEIISALMVMLSCLFVDVVCDQSEILA